MIELKFIIKETKEYLTPKTKINKITVDIKDKCRNAKYSEYEAMKMLVNKISANEVQIIDETKNKRFENLNDIFKSL